MKIPCAVLGVLLLSACVSAGPGLIARSSVEKIQIVSHDVQPVTGLAEITPPEPLMVRCGEVEHLADQALNLRNATYPRSEAADWLALMVDNRPGLLEAERNQLRSIIPGVISAAWSVRLPAGEPLYQKAIRSSYCS